MQHLDQRTINIIGEAKLSYLRSKISELREKVGGSNQPKSRRGFVHFQDEANLLCQKAQAINLPAEMQSALIDAKEKIAEYVKTGNYSLIIQADEDYCNVINCIDKSLRTE
jgi:hypothetical protein